VVVFYGAEYVVESFEVFTTIDKASTSSADAPMFEVGE